MNWLKRIFCSQEEFNNYEGLPAPENFFPESCKEKKPKPDISEPVHTMVKSMFDRPHTWKVKYSNCVANMNFYDVKDIRTKLSFRYSRHYYGDYTRSIMSYQTWMTEEEQEFLLNALESVQQMKMSRVKRIRQVKKNIERNKVKELYK